MNTHLSEAESKPSSTLVQHKPENQPELLDTNIPVEELRTEFDMEFNAFMSKRREYKQEAIDLRHPQPARYAESKLFKDRVLNPDFAQLGEFSDILFQCPIAGDLQERIDRARYQRLTIDNGARDRELTPSEKLEISQLKEEIRSLRDQLIPFNHMLRKLLVENPDAFTEEGLANYLSEAMGKKYKTARTLIAGVGAEVATYRLLSEHNVAVGLSTAAQEPKGIDLLVQDKGVVKLIDVKTGGNQTDGNVRDQKPNHFTLNLDRSMYEDFKIKPEYEDEILSKLEII
ncbi:hypothetical protein IT415_03160 [bacterium]|nr:hypothetical protein [bacterium]